MLKNVFNYQGVQPVYMKVETYTNAVIPARSGRIEK